MRSCLCWLHRPSSSSSSRPPDPCISRSQVWVPLVYFIIWLVTSVRKYPRDKCACTSPTFFDFTYVLRSTYYKPILSSPSIFMLVTCFSALPACVCTSAYSSSSTISLAGNKPTNWLLRLLPTCNRKQPYPVNGAKRIQENRSKLISAAHYDRRNRAWLLCVLCVKNWLFEGEIDGARNTQKKLNSK